MTRQRGEQGYALLLAAAFLILVSAAMLAARGQERLLSFGIDQPLVTGKRLAAADAALILFAERNRRLPCPADPTAPYRSQQGGTETAQSNGKCALPTAANGIGGVPWQSLGIDAGDAIDGWDDRILYQVYDGDFAGNGSLVQPNGMNFVACSLQTGGPAASPCAHAVLSASDVAGLGLTDPVHDPAQYAVLVSAFQGKTLNGLGLSSSAAAYVLSSVGATRRGFFAAGGAALQPALSSDAASYATRTQPLLTVAILSRQWVNTVSWPSPPEWPSLWTAATAQAAP